MKLMNLGSICFLGAAVLVAAPLHAQHYVVAGSFQGWAPPAGPELMDAGGGIYQATISGLVPGEFHQFKILETDELPADWGNPEWTATNNWFKVGDDGSITIKLNTAIGGQGQDAANVGTSSTNWVPQLVGSFQDEAGGAVEWNNNDPMFNLDYVSGTTWSKTFTISTAGTYFLKLVTNGSWDTQFNGHGYANLPGEDFTFDTTVANQQVMFTFDSFAPSLVITPIGGQNPSIAGAAYYHAGFSGGGTPPWNAIDTLKTPVQRGASPVPMTLSNLTNSNRGLNGVAVDLNGIAALEDVSFEYTISPTGTFGQNAAWSTAPAPTSVVFHSDAGVGGSDRVLIQWANNAIANRYLRVRVLDGLNVVSDLYLGHLLGETSGASGGVFAVQFADVPIIRNDSGNTVGAGSATDIDKNGNVAFADIAAMRGNIGAQLTQYTVPAAE